MSLWLPQSGKLYLPPSQPVAKILPTDEFVVETSIFFHASSDRLLTVGHPYYPITKVGDGNGTVVVPKVSGNQFRAFRVVLPDPNKLALVDSNIYNPESERLVWKLRGLDIGRGGPLSVGSTGHPLFNKLKDTENPNGYFKTSKESRQNVSMDPKQTQLFVVGCTPCLGAHWDAAKPCADAPQELGACPPLELVSSVIQDGDMCDIGFGAMNFAKLQEDHSGVPLDIVASTCKWPDFLRMANDVYGNQMFFFGRREQLYARHFFARDGLMGDPIPEAAFEGVKHTYILPGEAGKDQNTASSSVYYATPSGSLVSSDSQLFGRPYWIQKAQGPNNSVCWKNNLFITLVDNTHNVNFTINVKSEAGAAQQYAATSYKHYVRHVEEFEIALILQLCKVPLTADVLAHIHVMDPAIIEDWQLGFVPPPPTAIGDTYRFLTSLATRCPAAEPPKEKQDPYDNMSFWKVDLTERLSSELDRYPLGRRFLSQTGATSTSTSRKRSRTETPTRSVRSAKKRRRGV